MGLITIEKHIVIRNIKKLYNDYLKPFFMFFVDGLSDYLKILMMTVNQVDVIKENGKLSEIYTHGFEKI